MRRLSILLCLLGLLTARGWGQQAADLVLVNTRSRLYPELLRQSGWRVLYRDAGAALFGRAAEIGRRGVAEKTTKEEK